MALTEERIEIQEPLETLETREATVPTSLPPEANGGWSPMWLLIVVGAVAAVVLAVLAFRPDSEAGGSHQQVIEQGSPTAVDHAAQVVVPNHQQVIEQGSPTAVDHAAGGAVTGTHQQVIEQGSPTAVDHAAGGAVTGTHQQVIEQGSPTAVDHAAGGAVTGTHQQVIEQGSPTAVDHAASS